MSSGSESRVIYRVRRRRGGRVVCGKAEHEARTRTRCPSTVISPPCASTISRVIANPRPVLAPSRVSDVVDAAEAFEDPLTILDGMPIPSSAMRTSIVVAGLLHRDRHLVVGVPFGVVEHVAQRASQLIAISEHLTCRHPVDVDRHATARPEALGLAQDEIVEVDRYPLRATSRWASSRARVSRSSTSRCISVTSTSASCSLARQSGSDLGSQVDLQAAPAATSAGSAAHATRRRRSDVGDRRRRRAGRASSSSSGRAGRPRRGWAARAPGDAARPRRSRSTSERIASTGRSARPVTFHVVTATSPTSSGRPIPNSFASCWVASSTGSSRRRRRPSRGPVGVSTCRAATRKRAVERSDRAGDDHGLRSERVRLDDASFAAQVLARREHRSGRRRRPG